MLGPRISRSAFRAIVSPMAYESWSKEDLIARIKLLEANLPSSHTHVSSHSIRKKLKDSKIFDFSSYPRRKIALKFCYAGWEYNGLAFQNDKTPLPTVEGTLYNALASCKLIDPKLGPEGCGWERCGRTDRGVSSAGQVVSLWVRSNLQDQSQEAGPSKSLFSENRVTSSSNEYDDYVGENTDLPTLEVSDTEESPTKVQTPRDELRYVSILNRVLPPSIRIIAWSPVSAEFSSRFSCRYRHYKYFFRGRHLDISAMQDAASRLLGEHDFRNLCKLDASKQITSFKRKILRADISPVHPPESLAADPEMYVFDLIGTAFLYHQVRHIMAVLLLVGCGLEKPHVLDSLMNTDGNNPVQTRGGEPIPEVVDRKPEYQMADGLPLVLWDCVYNEDDVSWRTDDEQSSADDESTHAESNLYHQLYAIHTRSLIHSTLDAHFLRAAEIYHKPPPQVFPLQSLQALDGTTLLNIPVGGGVYRRLAAQYYVPLLKRKRLDAVEVANERWRLGKGSRRQDKKQVENNLEE